MRQKPHTRSRTLGGLIKLIDEWAGARTHFKNRERASEIALLAREKLALPRNVLEAVRETVPPTDVAGIITGVPADWTPVEVPELNELIVERFNERHGKKS